MMAVLGALRRPAHTIGLYIVFAPHAASVFIVIPAVLSGACNCFYTNKGSLYFSGGLFILAPWGPLV